MERQKRLVHSRRAPAEVPTPRHGTAGRADQPGGEPLEEHGGRRQGIATTPHAAARAELIRRQRGRRVTQNVQVEVDPRRSARSGQISEVDDCPALVPDPDSVNVVVGECGGRATLSEHTAPERASGRVELDVWVELNRRRCSVEDVEVLERVNREDKVVMVAALDGAECREEEVPGRCEANFRHIPRAGVVDAEHGPRKGGSERGPQPRHRVRVPGLWAGVGAGGERNGQADRIVESAGPDTVRGRRGDCAGVEGAFPSQGLAENGGDPFAYMRVGQLVNVARRDARHRVPGDLLVVHGQPSQKLGDKVALPRLGGDCGVGQAPTFDAVDLLLHRVECLVVIRGSYAVRVCAALLYEGVDFVGPVEHRAAVEPCQPAENVGLHRGSVKREGNRAPQGQNLPCAIRIHVAKCVAVVVNDPDVHDVVPSKTSRRGAPTTPPYPRTEAAIGKVKV